MRTWGNNHREMRTLGHLALGTRDIRPWRYRDMETKGHGDMRTWDNGARGHEALRI